MSWEDAIDHLLARLAAVTATANELGLDLAAYLLNASMLTANRDPNRQTIVQVCAAKASKHPSESALTRQIILLVGAGIEANYCRRRVMALLSSRLSPTDCLDLLSTAHCATYCPT
jgi:hypothetical protein